MLTPLLLREKAREVPASFWGLPGGMISLCSGGGAGGCGTQRGVELGALRFLWL